MGTGQVSCTVRKTVDLYLLGRTHCHATLAMRCWTCTEFSLPSRQEARGIPARAPMMSAAGGWSFAPPSSRTVAVLLLLPIASSIRLDFTSLRFPSPPSHAHSTIQARWMMLCSTSGKSSHLNCLLIALRSRRSPSPQDLITLL